MTKVTTFLLATYLLFLLLIPITPLNTNTTTTTATNNHALILSSSTFFHNYRHTADAFLIYNLLKLHHIPDSNILLLIADDPSYDYRNPQKNSIYAYGHQSNLYNQHVEIDYKGSDVTPELFKRVLLGTTSSPNNTPLSKQMTIDENSNVLIYMAGHGGDGFFKFRDMEEMTSRDIANIIDQMEVLKRFRKLLFMVDTCQAFTLFDFVVQEKEKTNRNVICVGSSLKNENSYAYAVDTDVGVSSVDRFTRGFVKYVKDEKRKSNVNQVTLQNAVNSLKFQALKAHVGIKAGEGVDLKEVTLDEFFERGNERTVEMMSEKVSLKTHPQKEQKNVIQSFFTLYQDGDYKKENDENQNAYCSETLEGMDPSDPRFMFACIGLLLTLFVSTQLWGG